MDNQIMTGKLALVAYTTAEWATIDKIILKGQPVIEFADDGKTKLKVGDGVNTFANLPYVASGSSDEALTFEAVITALGYQPLSPEDIGVPNGVVPLDSNSKIASTYLPSYVDDCIEVNGIDNAPTTGESGKIYIDTLTNKCYRWSGTMYTEIGQSVVVTASGNNGYINVNGTDVLVYKPIIDTELSDTSDNAVANKVVTTALNNKLSLTDTLILNCTL